MKNSHLTLRLPDDLARALARLARTRGRPKSEVVREAVSRYLAPAPPAPAGRRLTARDLATRWPDLPRLDAGEAAALAEDIARARATLPAVGSSWE